IGRDHERALIDQALTDARGGRTRWLLLTGPAGIGKTRLAEELVWRARPAGGQEAWARCSDEDGAPAWWPIRQIVRALTDDSDAVLVLPPGVDADEARFTVYERVAALLEATARPDAPVVVVVDDVQWADRTSARCLAYLASSLRTAPVVFALTLRDTEDQRAIEPLLSGLARTDGGWQLGIGPLATGDVRALADRVAADPLTDAQASALAERTGGNPLFVSEFARLPIDVREGGDTPLAVRSVLGRRLASVDEDVLGVLRPAAVLGELIDLPALSAATGQDPDALADLLDLAADARLVVPATGTGGYAFAHALLRQELLDGMSAVRRQRWHARIAAALADTTDADRISQRARHLVAAASLVDPADVVEGCRAAAVAAEAQWSADAAAGWWAEALRAYERLPSDAQRTEARDELTIAQVEQFARAGRGQSVMEVIDAGMLEAMRNGRSETVGRLAASLVRSAGSWPWLAYGERPLAMLERLESVRTFVEGDPGATARVLAALAVGRCYDPDASIPADLSTRALALAEEAGTDDVLADAILGRMLAYSGVAAHSEECLDLSARLERLEHPSAPVDRAIWRTSASIAQLTLGRVVEAEALVAEAIAMSDAQRLPIVRAQLRWMQGALDTWHGDLDGARRHHDIATRVHVASEIAYPGSVWLAEHGVHLVAGTLATADVSGSPMPDAWGAAVAAVRGEPDAVRTHATAWLDDLDAWTWITLGHLTLVAFACAEARLTDMAPRILDLLEPYAGHIGSIGHTGMVGPIDLATGRLNALLGHRDLAEAQITAALELTERTGGELYAGRCRAALAELRATA
ncbi:MAG: AAA family ATPase, partial [Solirubrobacteraceae bacterium]